MLAGEYEMDACAAGASAQMRVCAWPRGAAGFREVFLTVGALPLANQGRCSCCLLYTLYAPATKRGVTLCGRGTLVITNSVYPTVMLLE